MGEKTPAKCFLGREWYFMLSGRRTSGAEAFAEFSNWCSAYSVPAVCEDGKESAEQHDVLHSRLELLWTDFAVENRVGGARGGYERLDCVIRDGESGDSREGGKGEVQVWKARACGNGGEGIERFEG